MTGKEAESVPPPSDWTIKVEEVSAGVYSLVARDLRGRTITCSGTDPDALLEECRCSIKVLIGDPSHRGAK